MSKKIYKVPYSWKFDGEQLIDLGNMGDLGSSMADELTISFWFMSWDTSGIQSYPLGSTNSSGTYMLLMFHPSTSGGGEGKLGFAFRDQSAGELWVNTLKKYNDGVWHQVTFRKGALNTFDDTDIFIDGILIEKYNKRETGFSDPANFNRGVAIGAANVAVPSGYLKRTFVSQLSIWKAKLTDAQILAIYESNTMPDTPFANYLTKEGGLLTTEDEQGNHDGTLSEYGMWNQCVPSRNKRKDEMAKYPSRTDADSTKLARCNTYNIDAADIAANTGITGGTLTRDFMLSGWSDRVRQFGEIREAKFRVDNLSSIDSLKLTLWRRNSSGLFDRVGMTENLVSKLTDGIINEVDFDTVMDGELGDYWGYQLEMNTLDWTFYATTGLGSNYALRQGSGILGDTDVDWFSETVFNNITVNIELYMKAPQVVITGNSIMASHNENDTFVESGSEFYPEKTIAYKILDLLRAGGTMATYQNMSIGGQSSTDILARFDQDVINLYPQRVFMSCGINDVATVGYDEAVTISNITEMFDKCVDGGVADVTFIGNMPYGKSDTTEARDIDSLNIAIKALCDTYEIVTFVPVTSQMGKFREGGDAGNRWDLPLSLSVETTGNVTMESGTNTTTIKSTAHGLLVNYYIVQVSRGNIVRKILTVPDADTFTVEAVTGQTDGDIYAAVKDNDIIHLTEDGNEVMAGQVYKHIT